MVTGVETAGIVLASIPLVVSALEHYAEGVNTITKWWSYRRELASLVRVLDAEYAQFLGTCEKLLEGLVPPDELEELIADPRGAGWNNHELDRKLKGRLRRSYGSYLSSVKDMEAAVRTLAAKLELDPNGKPLWGDYHTFKHEYKRIKFSLSRRQYEESMKRIEKNNDILAKLTDRNLELEPARKRRSRPIHQFRSIQDHAGNLYNLIKRGWKCDCGGPHNANLQLDARLSDNETHTLSQHRGREVHSTGLVQFKVVFSVSNSPSSKAAPVSWQETEIRLLDQSKNAIGFETKELKKPLEPMNPKTMNGNKSASMPTSFSSLVTSKEVTPGIKPKKGVKFAGPSIDRELDELSVSMSKQQLSGLVEIRNICLVMQQCLKNVIYTQNCLGYLCEEGRQPLGVYMAKSSHIHVQHRVTSLADILTKTNSVSNRFLPASGSGFSRADRLGLALTIASSTLQLYKTPWLRDDWNKHDILINETGKDSYREQAYVSGTFSTSTAEQTTQEKIICHFVRNETLFALGIVLIELCLGQALESMRSPEDPLDANQKPNVLTDLSTSERLLDTVYMEAGKRYGDAVRRCIYCEFDQRRTTLDNDEFRQAVYDGVVAPLEDDMKDFYQL
ncbi:MAG: hypothetical protein Q9187_000981 [Circinaria calcarea]